MSEAYSVEVGDNIDFYGDAMEIYRNAIAGIIDIDLAIRSIRVAEGDQCAAAYHASCAGWWPLQEAIDFIRTAKGDQAMISFHMASGKKWDRVDAIEFIKTANGNQALAAYWAGQEEWWDRPDVCAFIHSRAKGDRAFCIRFAASSGWWPEHEGKSLEQLKKEFPEL